MAFKKDAHGLSYIYTAISAVDDVEYVLLAAASSFLFSS